MTRRELLQLLSAGVPTMGCGNLHSRPRFTGPKRLVGYVRTNWSRDPYAYGSYSYVSKESPGDGESDRAEAEAPVEGRIFFAGEALNPRYRSSVHAAYESGQRVAARVGAERPSTVCIVGAGMSGLSAAHRLTNLGIDVTVIEARDRIGGRIWTARSLDAPVDLGATWIHGPKGNPLTTLADDVGMRRFVTGDEVAIRNGKGRRISNLVAPRWLEEVAYQTSSGAKTSEYNEAYLASDFAKYGTGYEGPDLAFPGGYDAIFEALAGDYTVELSSPVERVILTDTGVAIQVAQRSPRRFDATIVTVPLGVLKRRTIKFEPGLPSSKQAAIGRIGMGTLDKLYLQFEEPFWDNDAAVLMTPDNGLPRGQFNYWVNFHRDLGVPILLAFNAASSALSLAGSSDEAMVAMALQTLDRAYPT